MSACVRACVTEGSKRQDRRKVGLEIRLPMHCRFNVVVVRGPLPQGAGMGRLPGSETTESSSPVMEVICRPWSHKDKRTGNQTYAHTAGSMPPPRTCW